MAKIRSKNQTRRRNKGRGDYTVTTPDDVKNTLNHIDNRLNQIEKGVKSSAKTTQGQVAGTLGRLAGGFLGNADLGGQAAEGLAKWFGYGDYSVAQNSLMGKGQVGLKFDDDGRRGIRITEREYLGDIVAGPLSGASTGFDLTSYPINPGDHNTFPWLSRVAEQFEQYKPNGIIFEYISTSSEFNGTNQSLGVVVAATDYDVLDANYSSKVEMEASDYACSTKASENMMHGIECAPRERPDALFYVRTANQVIPAGDSKRFYDLGKFQIATKGMSSAGVVLGELWVSYDFTFYKKQLIPPTVPSSAIPYFMGIRNDTSNNEPFGDNGWEPFSTYGNFLPTVIAGTALIIPASNATVANPEYYAIYCSKPSDGGLFTLTAANNCTLAPEGPGEPWSSFYTYVQVASALKSVVWIFIEATAPNARINTASAATYSSQQLSMAIYRMPTPMTIVLV
jgi:hypothetical protein